MKAQVDVINDGPFFLIQVMTMHHWRLSIGEGLTQLSKSLRE